MDNNNILQFGSDALIDSYFVPWIATSAPASFPHKPSLGNTTTGTTTAALKSKAAKEALDQTIIDAMNKIIRILRIFGMGYFYQSSYYCRETALELQKLEQAQYDTAPVLCLLGQAYYDAGDHQMVSQIMDDRSVCQVRTPTFFFPGTGVLSTVLCSCPLVLCRCPDLLNMSVVFGKGARTGSLGKSHEGQLLTSLWSLYCCGELDEMLEPWQWIDPVVPKGGGSGPWPLVWACSFRLRRMGKG